jgi:hypothetical protein
LFNAHYFCMTITLTWLIVILVFLPARNEYLKLPKFPDFFGQVSFKNQSPNGRRSQGDEISLNETGGRLVEADQLVEHVQEGLRVEVALTVRRRVLAEDQPGRSVDGWQLILPTVISVELKISKNWSLRLRKPFDNFVIIRNKLLNNKINYEEFQPACHCCRYSNPKNGRVDFEDSWLIKSSYIT